MIIQLLSLPLNSLVMAVRFLVAVLIVTTRTKWINLFPSGILLHLCDVYIFVSAYSNMEFAVTVGQDKKINAFNTATGKLIRSFKQDGDIGDPVKVNVDPSCSFLVCSYSSRSICMYDFSTGEIVARAVGHGEVINGIIFLPDCKHIVFVAGDGCIFVWDVPAPLSSKMLQKIKENSRPFLPTSIVQPLSLSQIKFHEEDDHQCTINPEEVAMPKK